MRHFSNGVAKVRHFSELKYNRAPNTAIAQIKAKNYPEKIREYVGNLLLVGISYDRKKKTHRCKIEKM